MSIASGVLEFLLSVRFFTDVSKKPDARPIYLKKWAIWMEIVHSWRHFAGFLMLGVPITDGVIEFLWSVRFFTDVSKKPDARPIYLKKWAICMKIVQP